MKQLMILIMLMFSITIAAQTTKQAKPSKPNVEITSDGNFKAITASPTSSATKTDKTYTDSEGKVHPVWLTAKGKHFVIKTSKNTGKEYRYYLKLPTE